MNILTFKVYMHHRMHYEFSFLPHQFYVWNEDGYKASWWFPGVSQPENFHYVTPDDDIDYHIALVGTIEQAQRVRNLYPHVPIVACIGSGMDADHPLSQAGGLIEGVVFSADRCARRCLNNKVVIRRAYDPERLKGYIGDVELAITVINRLEKRRAIYNPDFTKEAVGSKPHTFIGLDNEHLEDCIGMVDFHSIVWFYKYCRILVFCPENQDSVGPSAVVPEAMMTGMPVALTPFADWPDIVSAGGIVSDNLSELSEFILHCMTDRDYAQQVGRAGREIAINYFSFERFKNQWNELITAVMDGRWIEEFS